MDDLTAADVIKAKATLEKALASVPRLIPGSALHAAWVLAQWIEVLEKRLAGPKVQGGDGA